MLLLLHGVHLKEVEGLDKEVEVEGDIVLEVEDDIVVSGLSGLTAATEVSEAYVRIESLPTAEGLFSDSDAGLLDAVGSVEESENGLLDAGSSVSKSVDAESENEEGESGSEGDWVEESRVRT